MNIANYNSMLFYDPVFYFLFLFIFIFLIFNQELVLGTKSWEEFVGNFTKFKYFVEAKYFRQVVFGNLNGKKLTSVQKKILSDVNNAIKEHNSKNEIKIEIMGIASSDEMMFKTTKETLKQDFNEIKKVINGMGQKYSSILRIEPCKISLIHPEYNGFVKKVFVDLDKDLDLKENSKITFKGKKKKILNKKNFGLLIWFFLIGIPAYLFPQFYKYYFNLDLHKFDLKFLYDNEYVVSFDIPLFGKTLK